MNIGFDEYGLIHDREKRGSHSENPVVEFVSLQGSLANDNRKQHDREEDGPSQSQEEEGVREKAVDLAPNAPRRETGLNQLIVECSDHGFQDSVEKSLQRYDAEDFEAPCTDTFVSVVVAN